MSDIDDHMYDHDESDPVAPDTEEMDQDHPDNGEQATSKAQHQNFAHEEEEEEEEDEDEEEEEDGVSGRKGKKRAKHHHRRSIANRFLDIEAEVSDEEDEEEEDEDYGGDGFIETVDEVEDDSGRRHYALLDNKRAEAEDKSPEQIAKDLSQRYRRTAVRYTGDMNEIPQRLLMPSVHDASLWQVRVRPGRERDIVFSLMRKSLDMEYSARPLTILSAFQRDSLPGMIYVEARSAKQVSEACNGLVGVFPSRGITLVPIEEMASLLQIKKQDLTVMPGSWVRIKRGKYAGDLAQVVDITENGEDVGLKFIPRIDLNPRDDGSLEGAKKRKKVASGAGTMRPPQRLFNYEEIIKVWGRKHVSKRNQVFVFQNDTYKDGFIEKDFKLSALILDDVNPTLDEITQFRTRQDGADTDNLVDLSIIAEASRKAAISVLQPGDHVEVFEGEQAGVHGTVDEIHGDVVIITAVGVDLDGQKVELPARSVRKRFKPGDHVKVMTGHNADETGLVVSVADNIVTFLSDMSMQEVSVFSKDLREAAEVGSGTNIVGNYELHDLVQLDAQTVGVIFKTERDSFRVLDQNGQVRLVQPHQISMRRDSNRAIATDSEGHELRINDNVKEIDGEGRKGQVLHIHQSFFAFLHNRDIIENGGVFVTRARSLASLAPKGNIIKAGTDLSKMNPSMGAPVGGMVGSGGMGRGPRDRDIGLTVCVVKGAHKGYVGTIKDVNGPLVRVELRTGNKVVSLEKDKLRERLPNGKLVPLTGRGSQAGRQGFGGGGGGGGGGYGSFPPRNVNPYASGANVSPTPAWGGGRTPNPYNLGEGRTPAWNAASRTPNPYADGGKTPAWNASSRTPNPYADGGRTPAWNANSRTPNPYASGGGSSGAGAGSWGGATPGHTGWGGATPKRTTAWGATDGWSSPARTSTSWSNDAWSAPTPAAAAATPAFGAPTPLTAPTPAASGWNAQTPAGVYSSSQSGWSAPTPVGGPADDPPADDPSEEDAGMLKDTWIFDQISPNYLNRVKVKVFGTRLLNYLDGDYENKCGRLLGAARAATGFEQTATIRFDDGDQRTILAKYLVPVTPTHMGEEAWVMTRDKLHGGKVVIVRETPDAVIVPVSMKESSSIFEVQKDNLVVLYPES
ncbi:Transcription elongation factor SPT5 [Hypsizygus marmoreus]|uniref:Transcription elongation factor SPT5 n=1 Tax=Hypsizygus marmoreus TaxID=39966 RepID=A0A369J7Y5_HYPMA|nr:Transcription elongation factor SPT5 [Hypsizygus marmoreus]